MFYKPTYDTRVLLAASFPNGTAYLEEAGREGDFKWDSSDLSSQVAADTNQNTYVPPTGLDGSTGAWVRISGVFPGITVRDTVDFTGATVTDLGAVTTADINGGTIDGAVIGGAAAAAGTFAALTATGAFTSIGIDDNATKEVMQIADASMALGDTGTYTIQHKSTDQSLFLSGGSSASNGGNIVLYGQSNAAPSELRFRQSAINRIVIDDTAATGDIVFNDSAGTEKWRFDQSTGAITIGTIAPSGSELLRVNGAARVDGAFEALGAVKLGTHSALAGETVTGYITITDASGVSRKLAVVS